MQKLGLLVHAASFKQRLNVNIGGWLGLSTMSEARHSIENKRFWFWQDFIVETENALSVNTTSTNHDSKRRSEGVVDNLTVYTKLDAEPEPET